MRKVILIFVFLSSLIVCGQSGTYSRGSLQLRDDGAIIKWTLKLNPDGTFLYHFLRDLEGEANPEENYYGKGAWTLKGKLVYFYVKDSDSTSEFTVNLNNSKARYITKSPRDASNKVIKTALRFYESETFHIEGLMLFKE